MLAMGQNQVIFQQRFAALGARIPEYRIVGSSTRRMVVSRIPLMLAGQFRCIQFAFDNWYFGDDGELVDTTEALTITQAALEIGGAYVPVTFSGAAASPALPVGQIKYLSDLVWPSDFGLDSFGGDTLAYFRGSATTPTSAGRFPAGCIAVNSTSEAFFAIYDPANNIDQVYATGSMATPTGAQITTDFPAVGNSSATNNMGWGPSAIIGQTFDGEQVVLYLVGPSTPSGREYTRVPSNMPVGWGFMDLASYNGGTDVIPMGHATRSGGNIVEFGANPGIDAYYQYATDLYLWVGNNGLDAGYTAKQLVDTYVPIILDKAHAAGINRTIGVLGSPRTTSTDDWATYANQTYSSARYSNGGGADYLNRRLAQAGADGLIDITLPLPYIRSKLYDPFKWETDGTPFWMTTDGLHEPDYGQDLLADDTRWAIDTGLALPLVSRDWAAGCLVKPNDAMMAKVEAFVAASNAAGVWWQFAHWLNAPILSAGGEQTRRVNMIWPGQWDLYEDVTVGGITYTATGTKGNGTSSFMRMWLDVARDFNPGLAPELSPVLEDSITLATKVVTRPDNNTVIGNPTAASIALNPRDGSGNCLLRLNDGTNYSKPCPSGIGTFIGTRNGATREVFRNKVSLGPDTLADTGFVSSGLRLFQSAGGGSYTASEVSFFGVTHGLTVSQADAMTDAIDALTA